MKIYLCRECGHVQEGPNGKVCGDYYLDSCEACNSIESLDIYVKTERPNPNIKTWTDKLAIKRAKKGKKS